MSPWEYLCWAVSRIERDRMRLQGQDVRFKIFQEDESCITFKTASFFPSSIIITKPNDIKNIESIIISGMTEIIFWGKSHDPTGFMCVGPDSVLRCQVLSTDSQLKDDLEKDIQIIEREAP